MCDRSAVHGILMAGVVFMGLLPPDAVHGQSPDRRSPAHNRLIPNSGQLSVPDKPAEPNVESSNRVRETPANPPAAGDLGVLDPRAEWQPDQLVSPGRLSGTLGTLLVLTVVSIVPSILILTTCFVRFSIVLGLLRQALGTQQLPSNQVLMGLSLFLTMLVMSPVWQEGYAQGIKPYTHPEAGQPAIGFEQALVNTARPLRRFMIDQIDRLGNHETVWMLLDSRHGGPGTSSSVRPSIESDDDVPLSVLLPAFLLSELKGAFVIGFQLFLPFVIIDLVVSAVLVGSGLSMTPPTAISLPFKLLLFVLIDGWQLTVGMMLDSVRTVSG